MSLAIPRMHIERGRMDIATYIAASRLTAQERALGVVADNIANASTPGYKAQRVLFSDYISRQTRAHAPPGGAEIAYTQDRATWRDRRDGALAHTGNPFDLAIAGDGYFTVSTIAGPRLTRAGRFAPRTDGTVVDAAGDALLDNAGRPLQLSPADTTVTVAGDGTVSSENGPIGRIGVVRPLDDMQLRAEGGERLRADTPTAPIASPHLVQGATEDSNVQPVIEITHLIDDQRGFQFVAQFVQAEGERAQSAIDKILARRT
jgi:flagellar basal-body rod protein FlgF